MSEKSSKITRRNFVKGLLSVALILPVFSVISQAASLNPPKPDASRAKYSGYVRVTWSKVSKSQGYVIRRGTSTSFGSSSIIKVISSRNTKSYKDTGAQAGVVYYYWVCPLSSSTQYWYNSGRYAKGYRKLKSAWGDISGPSSLKRGQFGDYYLYINGRKITSSSVKWTASGSDFKPLWLIDMGCFSEMFSVGSMPVTIKAKYLDKTFKKKVSITGGAVSSCTTVTRSCYKHGYYKISSCSPLGCPTCRGEINW